MGNTNWVKRTSFGEIDPKERVAYLLRREDPCDHGYRPLGPILVCPECSKLQTRRNTLCLLCDDAGEVPVELVNDLAKPPMRCDGLLCRRCWDGLGGGQVAGWRALATG